jgi:predicted SprT family Zn-dependent metalloprotease
MGREGGDPAQGRRDYYKITCKCGNKYMMLRGMREYPFDSEPIYWCCICGRIKSGDEWNEPLVLEETD